MKRHLLRSLVALGLGIAFVDTSALAAPFCQPTDEGQLRCPIASAADCDKIDDLPLARDLFCPAAFDAAQTMVREIAQTLGVATPTTGFFYYFATPPDPESDPDDVSQTTVPCLDTPAPYPGGSNVVRGGGLPLCHLVAYVTSPGTGAKSVKKDTAIPKDLREFPQYFATLYDPGHKDALRKFRTGSPYDKLVAALGQAGEDTFKKHYGNLADDELYDPDEFTRDTRYRGISGGGGGGWGGEVAIVESTGPLVQLAFGGGGGGGMSSSQVGTKPPHSHLGAGGGGGMQFANGYKFAGKSYNGLGLGAGFGTGEDAVQYLYNDVEDAVSPPPVHEYNPVVIANYQAQLENLAKLLRDSYASGKPIVVRGGGGMGAGTEYLDAQGQSYAPHALSTQGGFQFNYQFGNANGGAGAQALAALNDAQEDVYAIIGDAFREGNRVALAECDNDYSNFGCMCPVQHAYVICRVTEAVGGDPTLVPGWLQQRHCPGDDDAAIVGGLTSYQRLLLDSANPADVSCTNALRGLFTVQNTPKP